MITCGNCGFDTEEGHSFCPNCGNALKRTCPTCQTVNEPSNKFCFNCGTSLAGSEAVATAVPESDDPVGDGGERRLVSVIFADLVGYTTLTESRDPEDVRAMLTRYYDRCREIIDRYGGTTDKFIGDAVMGVWGAVGAHEDDAERATRAAQELVDMVSGLGGELGIPELSARAGVLSGEASVGSGGNLHGLVVGDLVNTASRLQSIAPPGGVFTWNAERAGKMQEILDRYVETEDPQLVSGVRFEIGRRMFHHGRFQDATEWYLDHQDNLDAYPSITQSGIYAALLARDRDALSRFVDFAETWYPRGRVCKGLALLGRAFIAAVDSKMEETTRLFLAADELWSVVATPMDLARARALFAIAMGADHPVAAEKGEEARRFFQEHGVAIYLDGPVALVTEERGEVAV